jgi:hypothetical protein
VVQRDTDDLDCIAVIEDGPPDNLFVHVSLPFMWGICVDYNATMDATCKHEERPRCRGRLCLKW